MHGRIKTRSSKEQEQIKKQEREVKVKAYTKAMSELTEKRTSRIHDQEGLLITGGILRCNPDILTAWNFRREVLLSLKEKSDPQKLLDDELTLTEESLRVNPKSYGSWHHRAWALSNLGEPDWEREVALCRKFLQLDERNFHCWDYRRMVTRMAKVPDLKEYEFTLEKIVSNFSNYSAWHLRSKLLPRIFPDPENKLPINEEKHKQELELVQNAAFTDPNDQSAWFYQRWLLGLAEPKNHFVGAQVTRGKVFVAVSHNLNQCSKDDLGTRIRIEVNDKEVNGKWSSTSGKPFSTVWMVDLKLQIGDDDQITLHLMENGVIIDTLYTYSNSLIHREPNFIPSFSPMLKEVLIAELANCELLLEMEPDSKWTNLTSMQLMECIDADKYEVQIEKRLKKLMEIDPLRKGYYEDLYSKKVMELAIRRYFVNQVSIEMPKGKFIMQNKNLTSLHKMQYLMFVEEIDLSNNSLSSESLSCLHTLCNCRSLVLDNNQIKTLKYLPPLPKLSFLTLYNNSIEDSTSPYLDKFPCLTEFHL